MLDRSGALSVFPEGYMSDHLLRRTVFIGGAAALALTGWLVGRTSNVSAADGEVSPAASNVAVDCEPTQQALVRQIDVNGESRTVVHCVTGAMETAVLRAPVPPADRMAPALTPAVYRAPQPVRPVAAAPAPVRTVSSPAPQRASVERETSQRSWQQRALVIGGSAGAGAGIGALIGGKKGALIGAAIGGGSGTVYEVVKH
jgi:hypothetical protein